VKPEPPEYLNATLIRFSCYCFLFSFRKLQEKSFHIEVFLPCQSIYQAITTGLCLVRLIAQDANGSNVVLLNLVLGNF
jgi:hypothetical protein